MMKTSWRSVVAGVDASAEGTRAAQLAWEITQAAEVPCHLVHAVRDQAAEVASLQRSMDIGAMSQALMDLALDNVGSVLRGNVPASLVDRLEVQPGRPSAVLIEAARQYQSNVIVVGGKHHSVLGRWLVGATVHDLLRTSPVPVLVAGPGERRLQRVLVAADLSEAVRPTLAAAQRYAELFDGELLVMHVVEPVPSTLKSAILVDAAVDRDEVLRRSEELFDQTVWALVEYPRADRLLRRGTVFEAVREQARIWKADLVVAGSHGKGFIDRVLLGSVTQRIADHLPTSVLVVPAAAPARRITQPVRRAAAESIEA